MKTITHETDDGFEVEPFVKNLYRRVPIHWQRIFPAWYVMIIDHSRTFRLIPELLPVIKRCDFDARNCSELAEHADDWWSIRVMVREPEEKHLPWMIWVRHGEDREQLGLDFLSAAGSILWASNSHLRALWEIAMRKAHGQNTTLDAIADMFFAAFGSMMFDRRRFFCQHTAVVQPMSNLDEMIRRGTLSIVLD